MTDEQTTSQAEAPKKKRKKGMSPTARTLAECRKRGWIAGVVEKWNPHVKILHDLFGCIDIVAIIPGGGIAGIQATSGSNHSSRREKMLGEPRALKWCEAGGKLWLWSWAQRGDEGARKLWTLREEVIAASDFEARSAA